MWDSATATSSSARYSPACSGRRARLGKQFQGVGVTAGPRPDDGQFAQGGSPGRRVPGLLRHGKGRLDGRTRLRAVRVGQMPGHGQQHPGPYGALPLGRNQLQRRPQVRVAVVTAEVSPQVAACVSSSMAARTGSARASTSCCAAVA